MKHQLAFTRGRWIWGTLMFPLVLSVDLKPEQGNVSPHTDTQINESILHRNGIRGCSGKT